jgi:hypothetical protein
MPQSRNGLARSVGTDQAGDLAGGDNHVEAGVKKAAGMAGCKALGRDIALIARSS